MDMGGENSKCFIEQMNNSLNNYLSSIKAMAQMPLIIGELVRQLEKIKGLEKERLCKNRMVRQCFINASWAFQELLE